MIGRIRKALHAEGGFIDVFIIGMVGIVMLLGMGFAVVNFAYQSGAVTATQSLSTAVVTRAQEYAAALNQNLANPVLPSQAQECSGTPAVCTIVTSDIASGANGRTLTIVATAPYHQMKVTRQMLLTATTATHVSGLDASGNPTWVNSGEADPYKIWGVAQASIVGVPTPAQSGPQTPNSWNSVTTRAGVDATGALWVWGANDSCQAGNGDTSSTPIAPVKLDSGSTSFVTVVGDSTDEFAIDAGGNVYAWGENTNGELGLGTTTAVCSPTLLPGHHFLQMATSAGTTFGIDINSKLWAFGAGASGQLGNGTTTAKQSTPIEIAASTSFDAIATSGATTYAIDKNLQLWSWGLGSSGQLGTGSSANTSTAAATGVSTQFTHIAAGSQAGYAIDSSGGLWAWGSNNFGQLGDGTTTSRSVPTRIAAGTIYTDVTAGFGRAFAISSTGQLQAWGSNSGGELGTGNTGDSRTPTTVLPYSHFNSVIAASDSSITVGRDEQHALWAIGPTPGNHGVWQSNATTSTGIPLRMPAPAGFGTPAWN